MEGEVKLRSVCDACTAAKLRCNGKKPCERCLKKGVECNYQPYKNRGGNAKAKNSHRHQGDMPDTFLDDHERKTWSVFFTLYRSFGKGCSLYWFTNQLFRMLSFLEKKAAKDDSASNAYNRLKSWMIALGLDVNAAPPVTDKKPLAHLPFPSTNPPSFALTYDELRSEAFRRNLPMLTITKEGVVELNEAFTVAFGPSQAELQKIVSECGGGFLPWSGDVLARILARESDLVLYLQAVSNTMDAIGRPPGFPSVQVVPTMNVLKVIKKDGQEALCIVRAVQQLMLDTDDGTNVNAVYSSTIVLELSDMGYNHPQNASRVRPFSETSMANEEKFIEHEFKKMLESEPETTIPLPQDIIDASDDDEWLEGLLTWANEDFSIDDISVLPISDDMVGINAQKQN